MYQLKNYYTKTNRRRHKVINTRRQNNEFVQNVDINDSQDNHTKQGKNEFNNSISTNKIKWERNNLKSRKRLKDSLYKYSLIFILIITILLLISSIFGINIIKTLSNRESKQDILNFYITLAGQYNTLSQAEQYAEVVFSKGGAGLTKQINDRYSVIVSAYFNNSEAHSVKVKNAFYDTEALSIVEYKNNNLTKMENKVINDSINLVYNSIKKVQDTAFAISNNTIDALSGLNEIRLVKDEINGAIDQVKQMNLSKKALDLITEHSYFLADDLEFLVLNFSNAKLQYLHRTIVSSLMRLHSIC